MLLVCAGLVSLHFLTQPLHGMPSQHQRQPDHARFVGDVSAQSHPVLYAACIKALIDQFRAHESSIAAMMQSRTPFIVNTPGWIKVVLSYAMQRLNILFRAVTRSISQCSLRPCSPSQGIGLDMLIGTVQLVKPSHVVELQGPAENRNLPPQGSWLPAYDPDASVEPFLLCTLPALAQRNELPSVRSAARLAVRITVAYHVSS